MALKSNWLDFWLAQDEDTFPWDRHDAADVWQWSHSVADLDDDDGDGDGDYDDDDPRPVTIAETDEDTPVSIDVLAPFSGEDDDDDEQTIIYRFDAFSENGAEIRVENNQLVYDPSAVLDYLAVGETLTDRFFYVLAEQDEDEIDDPFGVWLTVTVSGVNDPPVIAAGSSTLVGGVTEIADEAPGENVDELTALGAIAFSDVDVSDTHTASFIPQDTDYLGTFELGLPTTTATTTSGQVSWAFSVNDALLDGLAEGEEVVQKYDVAVADPHGGVDEETVTVTLTGSNDAPVTDDITLTANEDGPPLTSLFLGDDVDSDDDQGTLTYTVLSEPTEGLLTNNDNGSFTFEPNGDFEDLALGESRSVGFTYKATDRHLADSNVSQGTITVEGANDRPVAQNVSASVVEDFLLGVTAAFAASDVDATDVLSYQIVSGPEKGSVINNGDGTFTYTPFDDPSDIDGNPLTPDNRFQYLNDGESEQVTFSYVAIDDSGAANDTSEVRTVTITVNGDNDEPLTIGQQLTFLSADQSIWGPGSNFSYQSLEFFGGSWNASASPTLLEAVELTSETKICIPFTDICTVIPALGIPALGVNASTSGTVGLLSDFRIASGAIDSRLLVDSSVTVPFQAAEGQTVSIDTAAFLDAMSEFSITTPFISYDLNLIFNIAADLGVWTGDSSNSTSLLGGGINFANAPGFDPDNPTEGVGRPLLNFSTNDASFELPDIIEGLVTATINIPNLDTDGEVDPPPPNVVESFAEDDFFIVGFDLDGIATALIPGAPALEVELPDLEFDPFAGTLSYNLLDLTLETSLTVTQAFDLTAQDFLFDIVRADTGQTVASDISAGDSFNFNVPTGVGDTLSFNAVVDPVATLRNQTGLGFDVDFVIDALSATLGFSAFDIDLVEVTAGPVFTDSIDIFNTGLGTFFDQQFALGGFDEKSFGFDLFVA